MRRIAFTVLLAVGMIAVPSSVAWAQCPGTFPPTVGSFNSANGPASSHLASAGPSCTVNADQTVSCTSYTLGGVGNTNATELLLVNYASTTSSDSLRSRNGQLNVRALSSPTPPPTPVIASFTYTLTFAGFANPYITITGTCQ